MSQARRIAAPMSVVLPRRQGVQAMRIDWVRASCALLLIAAPRTSSLAQTMTDGVNEGWRWRCAVVTATDSICNISPISNNGIAVRLAGGSFLQGSSLRGPDVRPIEFLSDLGDMRVRVDNRTEYRARSYSPWSVPLIRDMLTGHSISVMPNGKLTLGMDAYAIPLGGFKQSYCAVLSFLDEHGAGKFSAGGNQAPPGVDDDVCLP